MSEYSRGPGAAFYLREIRKSIRRTVKGRASLALCGLFMALPAKKSAADDIPWILCGEGRVNYLGIGNHYVYPASKPWIVLKMEYMPGIESLTKFGHYHGTNAIGMVSVVGDEDHFSMHYATLSGALAAGTPVKIYGSKHGYPAVCDSSAETFTVVTCEVNSTCLK